LRDGPEQNRGNVPFSVIKTRAVTWAAGVLAVSEGHKGSERARIARDKFIGKSEEPT